MSDTEVEVSCPHCGSTDLVSYDVVIATAGITGWTRDAAGKLHPEYGGGSDVDWDSQRPKDPQRPYQCEGCDAMLAVSELVVAEVEDDDAEDEDEDE